METKNNNSYIVTTGTIGALGGGIYKFRHPNEKVCQYVAQNGFSAVDSLKGYKDSFNPEAASKAVTSGKLPLNLYTKFKNLYESISDSLEKAIQEKKIINTPFEQRTKTLKEAIKESNASRAKFRRAMFGFDKPLQEKLSELNIFNKENFTNTIKESKKKVILSYKELSKGGLKGALIGAAVGVLAGVGLKQLFTKDTKKGK